MLKRDGYTHSLWQDNHEPYLPVNKPDPKTIFDVIIVGGGITGVSTAYQLQKAGKKCLIIEAYNLCFGTTGGTTAHLNTLLDTPYSTIEKKFNEEKARLVADSVQDALKLIKANIRDLDIRCEYEDADAYLFATDDKQVKDLEKIVEATVEAGLHMEFIDQIPISQEFLKAAYITGQGKFNPIPYVMSLAAEFEKLGGRMLTQSRVMEVKEEGDKLNVNTETDTWIADQLIYATHIPPGVNLLHLRCVPWRSYALAATLADDNYPDDLIYDMEDPYHYYRTQTINGEKFLIAGGKDHKTGHEENTERPFQLLEAHVRKYFDIKHMVNEWSSQYYESADGLPYIGHLPGTPERIFVATGFGGNGMIYSSVAAIVLRDMLTGLDSPYENLYDPNRLKPVAGFSSFVQHNTGVIKEYFKKLIPFEKISTLSELAAGEGRLVRFGDHSIALSKDAWNRFHAVSPKCTHLGCEVQWNIAEQSWDCPCHGARYNTDGKVLNGPAHEGLDKIAVDGQREIQANHKGLKKDF
ncbi:FAD-dependent oxidoreductase [Pollutibacter soli]|uniref:FAD-dependent oxidoreductase n=1 Tax=Pollutibacter soli TaxID=3034157 RepID=UPI0030134ECF